MAWRGPRTRGSTTARDYGGQHQATRAKLLPDAYGQPCTRCGRAMLPGQALHLDHTDDRTGYRGFSHAGCNVRAAAAKGARIANARRRKGAKIVSRSLAANADRW